MNKLRSIKNKTVIIGILVIIFITSCCIGEIYHTYKIEQKNTLEQKRLEEERLRKETLITNAQNQVATLYNENNIPKDNITEEEIKESILTIDLVEDEEIKTILQTQINEINSYRIILTKIDTLLVNDILISNYKNEDIIELENMIITLKEEWKSECSSKLDTIKLQKDNIEDADNKVKVLFSDDNLTKVKNNVTRSKYNSAKKAVNNLPQKDIKEKYNEPLNKVLIKVEEKEEQARREAEAKAEKARKEAEEQARKEAEIREAWIELKAPYISQNLQQIYNGCEAASLLMGLQYKGYQKGTTLKEFADKMPKSDDPHKGFVRDIYDREPTDLPHWIAPDALASYGQSMSTSSTVQNITGSSVETLVKELQNNNPVVVYITGGYFDDPVNWIEEVPNNVHVVLLTGYNPVSKQMIVLNPWTKNNNGRVYITESRFTKIYNTIGKKAVVIR